MPAAAAAMPVPKGLFDVVGATKWRDFGAARRRGLCWRGRGLPWKKLRIVLTHARTVHMPLRNGLYRGFYYLCSCTRRGAGWGAA